MTTPVSSADPLMDIAAVLTLLTHSPWHAVWVPGDLLNWVLPPIMLGQYLLVSEGGAAVAFASWAFVNDEGHAALRTDSRALLLPEWRGGPHVWVVDLVAPFGHVRQVSRVLRKMAVANGLDGKTAHWKRRYSEA